MKAASGALRGHLSDGAPGRVGGTRLGELTVPERTVLELLTFGEPLGQATMARLTDAASVEALENRGLISSRIEGRRIQVWLATHLRRRRAGRDQRASPTGPC